MATSIGSFNVLNLKTDTSRGLPSEKTDFKAYKVKTIARAIADNFSIAALQEVQSLATVEAIQAHLNAGSDSPWDVVHCDKHYQSIDQRFFNDGFLEKRAELAFVYDKRIWEFVDDYVLYKNIHDGIITATEALVSALIVAAGTAVSRTKKKDDSKQKETSQDDSSFDFFSALGIGGSLTAGDSIRRQGIRKFVQSTLRPPLIGIFRSRVHPSAQLRLINIHSRFAYAENALSQRKLETLFVLRYVYDHVNSQRLSAKDYSSDAAFTLVAGDFNLKPEVISSLLKGKNLKLYQEEKSTISCINKNKVESGEASSYEYRDSESYDHFVLDPLFWQDAQGGPIKGLNYSILRPPDRANPQKQTVSDHCPIQLLTNNF